MAFILLILFILFLFFCLSSVCVLVTSEGYSRETISAPNTDTPSHNSGVCAQWTSAH
ncbi:uncharacterized protein ASCRUDRAFT_82860 [Ascoidea rubescens DSM 1968]|uniref:Uncharacterized protein n=1 Tax=Ascoidea rubescens DSM 1968 TaxID=1344418 RepID=A0A1D2V9Q2_9ASCO|nr:hypothetical protein ASCRUDRAFT_82860 [Ascoidea rubescens DSM 1968]ODV58265.1 hypothetical protein ASCRUDRAFT_82860 [Ascoidea rubescens DSM 1968]